MEELNDKAYTLDLSNERVPKQQRNNKGQWSNVGSSWNKGKKWEDMFDAETIARLKQHLREISKLGNAKRKKGVPHFCRPVIQMDEDGNRLHWYESSAHAARKLGLQGRNILSVCYGDRRHCGGFRWKFDENFL